MPSDLEIADAETHAVYAYLSKVVQEAGPSASRERVLVQSDSLGCLDAIESAWRAGDASALRGYDRGALLEAICSLRARLELVVFMFTPSHRGIAPNAMADAAAKSHLQAPRATGVDAAVRAGVCSRPCVYDVRSDFGVDGILRPAGAEGGEWEMWDRRLFPAARRRLARWVHLALERGLSGAQMVDSTFVGRRGHPCEARTFAAVTRMGVTCAKLDAKEADPVGRMASDAARVSIVTTARQGKVLGVRGAQDGWWRRAYDEERRTNKPGWASRRGALGCACCSERRADAAVCPTCGGWQARGRRGRVGLHKPGCVDWRACSRCGGGLQQCDGAADADGWILVQHRRARRDGEPGRAMDSDGWVAGTRGKRRLGVAEEAGGRWVGFAGLARTTVERLVADGAQRDEDEASSREPLADRLADLRHVLGGGCEGAEGSEKTVREMLGLVAEMERAVVRAGGAASELRALVTRARGYLEGDAQARAARPEEEWEALRGLIACYVPAPDWDWAVGGSASAEREARLAFEKRLIAPWHGLLEGASQLRLQWKEAAAREVSRREQMEAGRGMLRVLVRAWREVCDDVRASAAQFDQRWQAVQAAAAAAGGDAGAHDCALARRLKFACSGSAWATEAGWQVRVLLAWQRLVRAGVVRRARQRSPVWRQQRQQHLRRRVHASTGAEGIASSVTHFDHGREEQIAAERAVSSGAAAVLARRRRPQAQERDSAAASGSGGWSRRLVGAAGSLRGGAEHVAAGGSVSSPVEEGGRAHGAAGPRADHNEPLSPASTDGGGTNRRGDSTLVFSERARERFEDIVGGWYWVKPPEGVG